MVKRHLKIEENKKSNKSIYLFIFIYIGHIKTVHWSLKYVWVTLWILYVHFTMNNNRTWQVNLNNMMYIEYVFVFSINYLIIIFFFKVTENEFNKCNINQFGSDPLTRRVITCNSPYDVMKYTLNFRSYLPIPNGFEFRPNQTYYFLSTSSSHQQCSKLKILVHDYRKCTSSFSNL